MRVVFDHGQLVDAVARITAIAGELPELDDELRQRRRSFQSGRGYPSASMAGMGRGPATVVDRETGDDHAVVVFHDSLAEQIANDLERDDLGGRLAEFTVAVNTALRNLETARGIVHKARPSRQPEPAAPRVDIWCTSCERAQVMAPRGDPKRVGEQSTLCGWCHEWQREYGQLPPVAIIERRARGERITTRVVEEATRTKRGTR